jgi:hypothetical protein
MSRLNQKDLLRMLTYRRPAGSKTELEFIKRYIDCVPEMYSDQFGNRILRTDGGEGKIMIACHTDTVHRLAGRQKIEALKGIARLPLKSMRDSNCLGADDTAGIYAALRMIEAGVKATFVFHRQEEIGGRGSQWLADHYPKWIESFDVCLSLDRRGTTDIIVEQFGCRTASDLFAWDLADALNMEHSPAVGIFTDSANYSHLIPECSNVSIGYQSEHTVLETLDLGYLESVIERLCAVDWSALAVTRDIAEDAEDEFADLLEDEIDFREEVSEFWSERDREWAQPLGGNRLL